GEMADGRGLARAALLGEDCELVRHPAQVRSTVQGRGPRRYDRRGVGPDPATRAPPSLSSAGVRARIPALAGRLHGFLVGGRLLLDRLQEVQPVPPDDDLV